MPLRIDDARMMSAAVPSGITPTEWNDLAIRFGEVHADVAAGRGSGRYGFLELEAQAAELPRLREYVRGCAGRFDAVVVLGIGGSALGAIALRTALGTARAVGPAGAGAATPRLHVLDNVDPATMRALLDSLNPARTLWCVISKSGGTVETLAQYAIARRWVEDAGLPVKWHVAVVTDPSVGPLRAIVARDGLAAFDVPTNVGGRFSVLTPVGTLPAALAGYDIDALLAGARVMRDRCDTPTLSENPAGLLATLLWRAHQRAGQGTHVMMPYSDALQAVAPWFVQLWGESLGKRDADGLPAGPTPLGARGATDQHSLLQLLMEGPADKVVVFVRVGTRPIDITVPADGDIPEAAAFTRGRTLGALLDAEADATARALVSAGRPSLTITIDQADARALGELLMCVMLATVYAGALYRVNPLDQPGVEMGKKLAKEALAYPR